MPTIGVTPKMVTKFRSCRHRFLLEIEKSYPGRYVDLKSLNFELYNYENWVKRIANHMPTKKKKDDSGYVWKGYCNVSIPSSKVPDAEKYIKNQDQVHQHLVTAFSQGISVKLYFDDKSDSYKCVLQDYNADSPNYGYAMSAFGSDWFVALSSALFKHFVLSKGDWQIEHMDTKRSFG